MNKLYVVFILLVLAGCTIKENVTPEFASRKLTYIFDGKREVCRQEDWFDKQNRIIQTINFGNRNNDTININKYYYSGDLLTARTTMKPTGELINARINEYTLGKLTGEIFYKGSDTITIKQFSYFENGKLKREVTTYPLEKINPITEVKYFDANGNLEKTYNQIYEDSTKLVWSRYEMQANNHIYDSVGLLTQTTATMLFGYYEITDTISVTQYRYNENKDIEAQLNIRKSANENIDSIKYNYNERHLPNNVITYFSGAKNKKAAPLTDTVTYVYDTNNRIIKELFSMKGISFRYEYNE